MSQVVFLERLNNSHESLVDQFERSFSVLSIQNQFDRARAIFIKPNLTYPKYKKGVTTRKEFVESLVAALRRINSTTRIYIGEGEGGYNSFSMTDAMRSMGYCDIEERYSNVKVVNISKIPRVTIELTARNRPYLLELPKLFFDEIDFSISCPLPKVHCMAKITLGLKNVWGCLPDTMRLRNHFVFDEIIGQICDKLKFRYAFLDGKYGLDTNGPMSGNPIEVNWFVASNSLGAFDMVVSEMMGFDWERISHLQRAAKYELMPRIEQVGVVGDLESLKKKFVLKRDLWNYPALVAFHSSTLTHLFYFSRCAKLLHDVMYTFRKRAIEE